EFESGSGGVEAAEVEGQRQSIADPVQPQALRSPRIRQRHLDRGEPGQVLVSALIGVCARLGDERFDDLVRRLQPPGTPLAAGELEVEFVPAVPARSDDYIGR